MRRFAADAGWALAGLLALVIVTPWWLVRHWRIALDYIAGTIFLVAFIGFWFWLLQIGAPK